MHICLKGLVKNRYICGIAVIHELAVNAFAAYNIYIIRIFIFNKLKHLFNRMGDFRTVSVKIGFMCKHYVSSVLKRISSGKCGKRFSSENNGVSGCFCSEKLHISGKMCKQLALVAYRPVFINGSNHFHIVLLLCNIVRRSFVGKPKAV